MDNAILKEKRRIAKKEYDCDACENLNADDFMSNPKSYGVSFADMRIMVKIRQEKFKVLKGTAYLYQVGIYDNSFYAIHCRFDAVELCRKYELFED
jgi:hypothetical protein